MIPNIHKKLLACLRKFSVKVSFFSNFRGKNSEFREKQEKSAKKNSCLNQVNYASIDDRDQRRELNNNNMGYEEVSLHCTDFYIFIREFFDGIFFLYYSLRKPQKNCFFNGRAIKTAKVSTAIKLRGGG